MKSNTEEYPEVLYVFKERPKTFSVEKQHLNATTENSHIHFFGSLILTIKSTQPYFPPNRQIPSFLSLFLDRSPDWE